MIAVASIDVEVVVEVVEGFVGYSSWPAAAALEVAVVHFSVVAPIDDAA